MKLTTSFDDQFEYEGRTIRLNMAFDNILRMFELFNDESLFDYEKIYIALEMLTGDDYSSSGFEEVNELFKYIMKEYVGIDLEPKEEGEGGKAQKFMDYEKDAELIFASFFAVYKVDLFELQGKLHWRKFQALLNNIDDESPFKKVVGYRTMPVPDEKKAGKEHKQHVIRMKQRYSLDERPPEEKMQDVFSSMFSAHSKGGGK